MKKPRALAIVFIGSFLLFGMQPMLGGTLLPTFGGSAAVWTVCLASYQTLLFVGYLYAHLMAGKPLRTQRTTHLALLGVATVWTVGFVFLEPHLRTLIGGESYPALKVVFCVLVFIGLPYVLLSAGSTLVQVWVSRSESGSRDRVYRLYAVSNLGSFAGLFAYPLLVEPFFSLRTQWVGFAAMLGVYTALIGRHRPEETGVKQTDKSIVQSMLSPRPRTMALWFFLPACSVFLLNAITAHITLDIMPLPLLWAALLALFLLSYVVGFSGLDRRRFIPLPFVAAGFAAWSAWMSDQLVDENFIWSLVAALGLCFFGPLFLHHWLYQLRPKTEHLTLFYLGNAAGGAIGGLSASILAPYIFKTVAEYPIAICLLGLALLAYAAAGIPAKKVFALGVVAAAVVAFLAAGYVWHLQSLDRSVVYRNRGFFGTIRVTETPISTRAEKGFVRRFYHGNTLHGIQAATPSMRRMPTSYFTPYAGGVAILQHPKYERGEPMRVAVAGLGVGVLFAYSREGDFYRGYEISREVLSVAENPALFSFVADSPADVDLVFGDARKALEAERTADEEGYDVLYVDAFSGDNLPRHLSTKEAFQLYFDRLAPGGFLAINISNRYLDLAPLIKAVCMEFNCPVVAIYQPTDMSRLQVGSYWAFFIRNPTRDCTIPPETRVLDFNLVSDFTLPTDEKGSFLGLVRWPWND